MMMMLIMGSSRMEVIGGDCNGDGDDGDDDAGDHGNVVNGSKNNGGESRASFSAYTSEHTASYGND